MFSRYQDEGFIVRRVDDEMLLLCADGTRLLQLNPTATLVWELCDGARGVPAIAAILAGRFDQPVDSLAADVDGVLSQLAGLGLVRASDDAAVVVGTGSFTPECRDGENAP